MAGRSARTEDYKVGIEFGAVRYRQMHRTDISASQGTAGRDWERALEDADKSLEQAKKNAA